MYSQSRQNMGYPVPAHQQPRTEPSGLPPPPTLQQQHQDPTAMMQHHMPQHPQHAVQPQLPPQPQHHQHQQALAPSQHQQQQQQPQQAITYTAGGPSGNSDWSGNRDGRSYSLKVEQQPIRARMCGFGDKDRRPITPPPCIRLVVCDLKTGKEIDFNDVDSTFFVLQVDLWHEDASRAVNLVRHSSAAPTVSISSSTVAAYPPAPERAMYMATPMVTQQWNGMESRMPSYSYHAGMPTDAYGASSVRPGYPSYPMQNSYGQSAPPMTMVAPAPPVAQNHTRNLIGMNAVNACRLNDPEGKTGFWFVLQDLSVRTEGTFRLKMSMCDIGSGQGTNACVSSGKCPVLASSFSEPFTVYSAKKFPGVIESTPLSKCFAAQGIKIPIRKDGPKERGNQAEYDADD